MYLLNEKTARELETISQHIHNTYDLGLYLDNVYVSEPITSIMDEEYLEKKLNLVNKCWTTAEKIYNKYVNVRYIRHQMVLIQYELTVIRRNLVLILRKKAVENALFLYGVSDISWHDFELLYTEYYNEVLNIDDVCERTLYEMYEVITGQKEIE